MKVSDAIEARRSVKQFYANHKMSDEEFKNMMDLVLKSPTSFNIQNWRFVRVENQEKRAQIREAAWGQAQITDASVLFVLCADVKAWEKEPERYWSHTVKETSDLMVSMMGPFYEGKEWLQHDEAMRSVGIAAQSLMLLAKEMGYDSCPMIGFDQDEVAKIINLPEDHKIGMILAIGKQENPPHPRGAQIDYSEAVLIDGF